MKLEELAFDKNLVGEILNKAAELQFGSDYKKEESKKMNYGELVEVGKVCKISENYIRRAIQELPILNQKSGTCIVCGKIYEPGTRFCSSDGSTLKYI